MRFLDLPKLKHAGAAGMSSALLAAALLLFGTSTGAGVIGALAQSATFPGTATTAVTDPVGSGGFARGSGATPPMTGDVTPAFSNTPTPAFSGTPTPATTGDVTPAFSNTPTPAFSGTPTPALSGTQTAPLGSTASPTPIDGRSSGDVIETTSAGGDISVNVSPSGTGTATSTRGSAAAQSLPSSLPDSRAHSATIVNSPVGSFGPKSSLVDGHAFIRSGNIRRAASQSRFVIVTDPAAPSLPATTAPQFTMVCNNGVTCNTPPRFVMNER